jgi:DsbC/DsbD-like thiol-disulfide interchange protein
MARFGWLSAAIRNTRWSAVRAGLLAMATSAAGASLLAAQSLQPSAPPAAGAAATVRTSHLTVQAAASPATVSPGGKVSLAIEVSPRRGMHVYAPGKHDYQIVRFTPDGRSWLTAAPLKYPPSEIYHFVPLDERVETYLKPFTLVQELTVLGTPEARKALGAQKTVTVSGTLEYQACDDKVCYAPAKVPLSLTLDVAAGGR